MTDFLSDDTAPTVLTREQQQRTEALMIARNMLLTSNGVFAGGKLPDDAVMSLTTLADWIITGECYPARSEQISGDEPTPVVKREQALYNQGWNDCRAGALAISSAQNPVRSWLVNHPAEFGKP